MSKYLALDKLATFGKIINEFGGLKGAFLQLLRLVLINALGVVCLPELQVPIFRLLLTFMFLFFRRDKLKTGTLVGEDKFGNKYYENPSYFYGKPNRTESISHVGTYLLTLL